MINKNLLNSAVRIRKKYLKVSSNMNMYNKRAKEIINILENSITKLNDIQNDINDNKGDSKEAVNKIMEDINSIDEEGKRLEEMVNPMNEEIEKLQQEEQELYRLIKEKYPDLSDDEIIKEVHEELQRQGL